MALEILEELIEAYKENQISEEEIVDQNLYYIRSLKIIKLFEGIKFSCSQLEVNFF